MAADTVVVKLNGIGELKRALAALPEKLRRKALLGPMKKAMRVVRDAAKQAVPVLSMPSPYRTKGLLKKKLTVRVSKVSRQAGNVGVFVNVRPAEGAKFKTIGRIAGARVRIKKKESQLGAKSPNDPFYWRFVEFGTKKMGARPFLTPSANKLSEALAIFEREVIPEIEKLNQRGA